MRGYRSEVLKKVRRFVVVKTLLVTILIVAGVIPAFSQGSTAANLHQAMKDIAAAAKSYEVKNGKGTVTDFNRETLEKLVAEGFLKQIPVIDPIICMDKEPGSCEWDYNSKSPGGTDADHPARLYVETRAVTEAFCKEFNKEVGLGSKVIPNCSTSNKCPRIQEAGEFPEDVPTAFCFKQEDDFRVYYDAGLGHGGE